MATPGIIPAQTAHKTLEFSGYTWEIRRSAGLEGPGPNRFLDNPQGVWLDDGDALHLRIWSRNDSWFAAEVKLTESLGYGTYIFETEGDLGAFDPPVVLGMFTYDPDPDFAHREIDIEYGLFGAADGPNAQFAIQPAAVDGNRRRFTATPEGTHLTHAFTWTQDELAFASFHGHHAADLRERGVAEMSDNLTVGRWTYQGQIPPPGNERVHINLWLYQTEPPTRDHEVTVRSFSFVPHLK